MQTYLIKSQKLFEVFIFALTGILVFKGELKIGTYSNTSYT